ncbi:hypothetical protein ACWDE9_26685 [Streptomyces olivaceoviridis]
MRSGAFGRSRTGPDVRPACHHRLKDEIRRLRLAGRRRSGARASGTPFLSHFTPQRMALTRETGFRDARHVPAEELVVVTT